MNNKYRKDIISSFTDAFRGLFFILRTQRNLRIHFIIAAFVILIGVIFKIPISDFLILILLITLVIISEISNTIIEMIIDFITDKYTIEVRRLKDVSASMVLVTTVSAVIVGYLILARFFPLSLRNIFKDIAYSPWYFTLIVIILISILYIFIKFFIKKGALFAGGMPSIHSGIAFSIWTIISFITFERYPLISFLVLLLAIWVAQGRILKGIHKIEEVVIGALGGILITVVIFEILTKIGFYK
ncbi:MAG: diacylglycerol kinase [Candidatus Omnitrophica bacterium]|jgi:diacylglycerol kinase (ATP)|nr:diacylglycerol kinase [Candidatus Omnitrophota bacterium]